MKTKEVCAIILFIGIYLNSGCKKNDNPVGPNDENAIMPLNLGNQWTFRITSLDSLGNVTQRFGTDDISIGSLIVSRDTMIQNERWYFFGPTSTVSTLFTNRSDGLWTMTIGQVSRVPCLFAKYPAKVNDTWLGPDSSTIQLTGGNVTLTVPQGTFTCLQYSHISKNTGAVSYSMYFSPGIGFVKEDQYAKTRGGRTFVQTRMELMGLILNTTSINQSNNQTWELTFQDAGTTPHIQTVKVIVTPFTYSGTFSETSDSQGLWMFDPSGNKCYKLPVGGNIVHDSPGDRWSFVGMGGGGCGMNTMGSNSSGTANGNFPNATYISNGVVTLTTTSPLGTVSGTVSWTGARK